MLSTLGVQLHIVLNQIMNNSFITISVAHPTAHGQKGNSLLSHVVDWVVWAMDTLGAVGAGFMMFLETIFPFIPSEVILPLAGFTISRGQMSFWAALFWTTLGSVITAWIYWGLGAWLGEERTRKIMGKLPLVSEEDIKKTENWFAKHGQKAVFFGRMIPIFRGFISIPAGVTRMPMMRFTMLTTAGSLIWNLLLIGAGYWLGEKWEIAETYIGILSIGVLAIVGMGLAFWVIKKVWKRSQEKRQDYRNKNDEEQNSSLDSKNSGLDSSSASSDSDKTLKTKSALIQESEMDSYSQAVSQDGDTNKRAASNLDTDANNVSLRNE